MTNSLDFLTSPVLRYGGWATVEDVSADRLRVRPSGDDDADFDVLPPPCLSCVSLAPGATVFILVPEEGPGVVISSLTPQPLKPHASRPCVPNGNSVVGLEDLGGALLFEYDEINRRTIVNAPVGDLEIQVPAGHLRLAASAVSIESHEIDLAAERATAGVGLLDVVATRVRSRVKIYRAIVEELCELRVGKLRLFARLGMLLKARTGRLETDQDLVLRGRTVRIN